MLFFPLSVGGGGAVTPIAVAAGTEICINYSVFRKGSKSMGHLMCTLNF